MAKEEIACAKLFLSQIFSKTRLLQDVKMPTRIRHWRQHILIQEETLSINDTIFQGAFNLLTLYPISKFVTVPNWKHLQTTFVNYAKWHVHGKKELTTVFPKAVWYIEDICLFRCKIEIYFIEWPLEPIFSRVAKPRVKIFRSRGHEMKYISILHRNKQIFCLFYTFPWIYQQFNVFSHPSKSSNSCGEPQIWQVT